MTQKNVTTGVSRRLREVKPRPVYTILINGAWTPCERTVNDALVAASTSRQASLCLRVGEVEFEYDLMKQQQQNLATQEVHSLRLVQCQVFAFEDGKPGSGNWKLCDDETCFALSEATAKGQRVLVHSVGVHEYRFDLVNLTQTNVATGLSRQLKLVTATNGSGSGLMSLRRALARGMRRVFPRAQHEQLPTSAPLRRLRRHGQLLVVATGISLVAMVVFAILMSSSGGVTSNGMNQYGSSITFLGCIIQMFLGAACSKVAACTRLGDADDVVVARHVRKLNGVGALLLFAAAILDVLESQQAIGALSPGGSGQLSADEARTFRTVSLAAAVALLMSALLHANLVVQATLIIRGRQREEREQRRAKEEGASRRPVEIIVVDDGSRVTLDAQETPVDDGRYVMYHGTHPDSAAEIEKYGFLRSRDGMLGPGVYLSRDIEKAAHYPLDVPAMRREGRVILECLVQVGKVKRIDATGHPMQKTWGIFGCAPAKRV